MVGCFLLEMQPRPLQRMAHYSVSNRQHASRPDCPSPPKACHCDSRRTSFLNYCLDHAVPPLGSNYYFRIGLFQTFSPEWCWTVSQIYYDLTQKLCSHRKNVTTNTSILLWVICPGKRLCSSGPSLILLRIYFERVHKYFFLYCHFHRT